MAGMRNLLSTQVVAGGTVRAGSAPAPTTASEAAYGTSVAPSAGGATWLSPDAGSIAVWVGLAGVITLAVLYYSLPG